MRDEAALIRVLQQRATETDVRLATCAAYALGNLPKTDTIVRELNVASLVDDELLMNYAIRSLLKFGNRQWVPAAVARLPGLRNRVVQLLLAGELARAGRYDGWDLIADAIVEGGVPWIGLERMRAAGQPMPPRSLAKPRR